MSQILYASIDTLEESEIDSYLKILPDACKADIMTFKQIEDIKARLLSRLILRQVLLQSNLVDLLHYWERDLYKKPFIRGWDYFNISHSNKIVVFGHSDMQIGVDIEHIRNFNYREVYNFLHPDEQLFINKSDDELNAFYSVWVRKEALFKAAGIGLNNNMDEISCTSSQLYFRGRNWKLMELDIHTDYIAAFCSGNHGINPQIAEFELHTIS